VKYRHSAKFELSW